MQIDPLPPIRGVLDRHDIRAKKTLGQNFLTDLNITAKIARFAGDLENSDILEIGPGPGALTRGLLAEGARKVIAIEKDQRCLAALAEVQDAYPGKLTVHNEDALRYDATAELQAPVRIVANLPYNVGTELLTHWLEPKIWPPFWSSLTLMFQKEVANRIVAVPGSKAYGRLSILAQWRADARIVMALPPSVFTPPPKIHSAVVHLDALPEPRFPCEAKKLSTVTRHAFGQRRKMLRASLKPLGPNILDILERIGIEPTKRAEQVSLEQFCALAREI